MNLEDSYRALGLNAGASLQEARRAYYQAVRFFHPDRYQASPGLLRKATEETKKLNLAYESICKALGGRRSWPTSPREKKKRNRSEEGSTTTTSVPVRGESFTIPTCGIKLNWIPAGIFQMGSPPAETGRSDDEGPQTEVHLGRGFWLGIVPVTQEEWKRIAEGTDFLQAEPSYFRGDRLPVEQISWNDCQAWLQELNAFEEGRVPVGSLYRLPTEAEWEYACRAGTSSRYYCGDNDAALDEHAWHSAISRGQTHPVGEKKPNDWGFYDLHGNVWEWCEDWYGPLRGGTVKDPRGPVFGTKRVFRGGSWGVSRSRCRSAYRVWNLPSYRDYTVGFRVALAPSL